MQRPKDLSKTHGPIMVRPLLFLCVALALPRRVLSPLSGSPLLPPLATRHSPATALSMQAFLPSALQSWKALAVSSCYWQICKPPPDIFRCWLASFGWVTLFVVVIAVSPARAAGMVEVGALESAVTFQHFV